MKIFNKTLIISGGKTDIDFAKEYLEKHQFDTVVCADSGLNTAYVLGLKVDYFMGDFDSVSSDVLKLYMDRKIPNSTDAEFVQYPAEKDATDTELVLDFVLENNPSTIVILGATGGRIDHLLANIGILLKALKKDIETYIVDRYNKIFLVGKNTELYKDDMWNKYISFYPYTDEVTNLRLSGLKYELYGEDIKIGSSRTVSNEFPDDCDKANVSFDDGILIVIQSKDK